MLHVNEEIHKTRLTSLTESISEMYYLVSFTCRIANDFRDPKFLHR